MKMSTIMRKKQIGTGGLEPPTFRMSNERSTPELRACNIKSTPMSIAMSSKY